MFCVQPCYQLFLIFFVVCFVDRIKIYSVFIFIIARMFDYFDAGIMERLQHNLIEVTEWQTTGDLEQVGNNTITLHSKVFHV